MLKLWIILGAANAFIAVAAGAFAAHGLRARLEPRMLEVFETAARYQMYHALALLAVGWLAARAPSPAVTAAGWCFLAGIVLFSGSLYLLSTIGGLGRLGMITPIGGTLFLTGWVLVMIAAAGMRGEG
jgi:uncharacterized membrane protein YgdD (TMEM256/DUF423 family)